MSFFRRPSDFSKLAAKGVAFTSRLALMTSPFGLGSSIQRVRAFSTNLQPATDWLEEAHWELPVGCIGWDVGFNVDCV